MVFYITIIMKMGALQLTVTRNKIRHAGGQATLVISVTCKIKDMQNMSQHVACPPARFNFVPADR